MKYRNLFVSIPLSIAVGCSSVQPKENLIFSPYSSQEIVELYCEPESNEVFELVRSSRPIFPRSFNNTGMRKGWAVTRYTVNVDGTVSDIEILDSSPRGFFEKAAVLATSEFVYKAIVKTQKPEKQCHTFTWQVAP